MHLISIRHIVGLCLVGLLVAAFLGAWNYWPDFMRLESIKPFRRHLTEWRIPLFTICGFLVLTLAEWGYSKTLAKH